MDSIIDLRSTRPDINEDLVAIIDDRSRMDLSHYKETYSILIRRMTAIGPKSTVCRELNEIVRDRRADYDAVNYAIGTMAFTLHNNILMAVDDVKRIVSASGADEEDKTADLEALDEINGKMGVQMSVDSFADSIVKEAGVLRHIESRYDPGRSTTFRYGLDRRSLDLDMKKRTEAKKSFINAMGDLDRMKALHNGYVKGATIMVSLNGLRPVDGGETPRSVVEVQTNGNEYDVLGADDDDSRFLIAIHNEEKTYEYYSIVDDTGESIMVMTTESMAPVELTWSSLFFDFMSLR